MARAAPLFLVLALFYVGVARAGAPSLDIIISNLWIDPSSYEFTITVVGSSSFGGDGVTLLPATSEGLPNLIPTTTDFFNGQPYVFVSEAVAPIVGEILDYSGVYTFAVSTQVDNGESENDSENDKRYLVNQEAYAQVSISAMARLLPFPNIEIELRSMPPLDYLDYGGTFEDVPISAFPQRENQSFLDDGTLYCSLMKLDQVASYCSPYMNVAYVEICATNVSASNFTICEEDSDPEFVVDLLFWGDDGESSAETNAFPPVASFYSPQLVTVDVSQLVTTTITSYPGALCFAARSSMTNQDRLKSFAIPEGYNQFYQMWGLLSCTLPDYSQGSSTTFNQSFMGVQFEDFGFKQVTIVSTDSEATADNTPSASSSFTGVLAASSAATSSSTTTTTSSGPQVIFVNETIETYAESPTPGTSTNVYTKYDPATFVMSIMSLVVIAIVLAAVILFAFYVMRRFGAMERRNYSSVDGDEGIMLEGRRSTRTVASPFWPGKARGSKKLTG